MKKTFIIAVLFMAFSSVYSQSGWISLNSGVSWEIRGMYFINENTGWVAGYSNNILRTTNGGINWFTQQTNWSSGYLSVYFINELTGYAGGGHAINGIGIINKTTNGGINWYQVFYGNTGAIYNTYFINDTTGWFACGFGNVLKTTNGGQTFTIKYVGPYDFVGIYFINFNTGWIGGLAGKIYNTTDSGLNWIEQQNSSTNIHAIKMLNSNTGFAGGLNGAFVKTTNSGSIWMSNPLGHSYWINHIHFINNLTGYLCGGTYNGSTPLIMFTSNGGENWINQTVPVNNWIGRIQFLNQYTGFAAGQGGKILKTTTGGFNIPSAPVLVSPANNSVNVTPVPDLIWNTSAGATHYKVQISTVPIFSVISDSATVTNTNYSVPPGKLSPGYTYYWRVIAYNSVGSSPWSSVWNFSTSVLPPAPVLISPSNGTLGTSQTPTLTWGDIQGVLTYKVQISTVPDFAILTDTVTVETAQYTIPAGKLSLNITYYWRVSARNNQGAGPYSSVWWFIPMLTSGNLVSSLIPDINMLHQNYPNPFNPLTNINFDVAVMSEVQLNVYDISGKTVTVLIDSKMNPGKYTVNFNGTNLSTGIYFARLKIADYSSIIRMVILK